jgi:hypothetical protein
MRRFISMLMVALIVAAVTAGSAIPAFAQRDDDNTIGGGQQVRCEITDKDGDTEVITVDAQVCVSLGGVIVDVL